MKLHEAVAKKGTYAAVKFSKTTVDNLIKFCLENDIKNALPRKKFHTTVLYSRKYLPTLDVTGDLKKPVIGTPKEFVVWETRSEDKSKPTTRCLVLKYDCPALVQHHKDLMKEYGATYDFDEYVPHITLSYDIGDLDIEHLQHMVDQIGDIVIVHEYSEDLELNWNEKT